MNRLLLRGFRAGCVGILLIAVSTSIGGEEPTPAPQSSRGDFWNQIFRRPAKPRQFVTPPAEIKQRRQLTPFTLFRARRGPEQPSDAMLASRARALLGGDARLTEYRILIDSDNGQLVLRGAVDSEEDRRLALELANRTDGIRGVSDQLTVRRPTAEWFQYSAARLSSPQPMAVDSGPTRRPDLPFVQAGSSFGSINAQASPATPSTAPAPAFSRTLRSVEPLDKSDPALQWQPIQAMDALNESEPTRSDEQASPSTNASTAAQPSLPVLQSRWQQVDPNLEQTAYKRGGRLGSFVTPLTVAPQ